MTSDPVTWPRDEHTKAKHDLLRAFFNKWVSIHSQWFASRGGGLVRIYDGFAGPGIYTGGEPGSPVILLDALCSNPRLLEQWANVDYELHFVERQPARAAMLRSQLEALEARTRDRGKWSERISWTVTCGNYEEHVPQPIVGRRSALFLFLDPFGYSHAPMTLTQDLVQQPKSDTLIFLPLSFVNRFAEREGQEPAMERFFGDSAWREVPSGPGRPTALLELFKKQLRSAGLEWVAEFRLKPDSNNEYWIVGGSGHLKGFASIKEAFWTVDPINGQGFVAPRAAAPGQQTLGFELTTAREANTAPLLELLREQFGGRRFTVEEAIAATERSRFLLTHLKQMTLAKAEAAGVLEVQRPPGVRQFKEGKGIRLRFS
ncbi:MAG: three-Cys-motif partner protein TcmP [Solirubrobacteraceae bacterium]